MAQMTCPNCGAPRENDEVCLKCFYAFAARPRQGTERIGVDDIDAVAAQAEGHAVSPGAEDRPEPTTLALGPHHGPAQAAARVDCRCCGGNTSPSSTCVHCNAPDPAGPSRFRLVLRPADPSAARPDMVLRLVEGEAIELGRGTGNRPEIMLALNPYDLVSRHHAEVRLLRRRVQVTDRSSNGTWAGAERIARDTPRTLDTPLTLNLGQECLVSIGLET